LYYFELNWQAATAAGANNGVLTVWMNGTQKETLTTLDNDTRRIDLVDWGQIAGTLTNASGTEYFDLFESHRTSYIGPDAGAPTPPAPPLTAEAIFTDGFEGGNMSVCWAANTSDGTNLSVTAAAKIVENYGLQVVIPAGSTTTKYVTDWTPWAEPHYRAQFRFTEREWAENILFKSQVV
jgi:hypothetical protein